MCTFIINDLNDREKDAINHPERPLPSGVVTPVYVVGLYYLCLAMALLSVRIAITGDDAAFWYYTLLTMVISYDYIVEYVPAAKAAYVAAATSIPIVILVTFFPGEADLYLVAAAVFVFMLGRELCMDIRDRTGDPISFLHNIEPLRIARFAFSLQSIGLMLVSFRVVNVVSLAAIMVMCILLAVAYISWFDLHYRRLATGLMKAVVFLGLCFLVYG